VIGQPDDHWIEMERTVFKRRRPDDPMAADAEPGPAKPAAAPPSGDRLASLRPADSGLGVPPFRPASPKDTPAMGRSPFPASPAPVSPASAPMPVPAPIAAPVRPSATRQSADRRTLVVGRGISVQGTVQDAERLVVEGTVEATMIHATELAVAQGGVFRGEVEVEDAEIGGTVDGTLTARGSLMVRSTGKLLGTARCRRLQVEDGGQITGRIEMITEAGEPAARPAEATTATA
jgi:cytoskeletal protein CcmA (bactofilin family)